MAAAVSSRPFSTKSRSHRGVIVTELLPSPSTTLPKPSPYLQSLQRLPRPSLSPSAFKNQREGHVSRRDSERLTGRTREVRPLLQRPQARDMHRENSRYRSEMGSSFPRFRLSSGDRFGSDRQRYGSPHRPLTTRQTSPFSRTAKRESSSVCRDRRNFLARQSTVMRPERSNSSVSRQGSSVSRKASAHKLSMRRYLYGNSVDIDPYAYFQHESNTQQEQSLGYTPPPLPEVKYAPFRRQPRYAAYAAAFRMPRNKTQENHVFKYSHSVMCALNGITQEEETKPYPQVRARRRKQAKVKISTFEIPQDVLVKLHKDNTLRILMTPGSPRETRNQSASDVRSTSRDRTLSNGSTSRELTFSNGSMTRERTFSNSSTSRERTFSNASSASESLSSPKFPRKKTAAVQTMTPHKSARSSARRRDDASHQVTPVIRIN